MARTRAGDEDAFAHLIQRYLRSAMAVAWEFTDTIEEAEDIVQDAFRRVIDGLDRFDTTRPFRPWLFTILRNTARNAAGARSLRLHRALDDAEPDLAPSPLEQIERAELQARVDAELEMLPEMQRACFRLCILEGMSSVEVAEALGLSDATVRTHVYRARQVMRRIAGPFVDETEQRR
ncbi:MAG: sigma-70 family RNA polymerase sigma factor [Gemmatimonadetes bacterium]|nr:sigma-70 family RNA polymerase sigma factor [Gemmatimonadota bacterium]